MNKNKGRNFLLGLAVIFIATKVYMSGILNEYGYMLMDQPTSQQLASGDDVVRGPAADLVDLVVDVITIIGYVAGIIVGGIYDTVKGLIGAAGEGARKAKDRIDDVGEEAEVEEKEEEAAPDDPALVDDPILVIANAVQANSVAISELSELVKADKSPVKGNESPSVVEVSK